jgi:putative glutamine amidotransferase
MEIRPRIAILGRFAESTSVTRYAGVVNARRLLEAVHAAGGEPITLLPTRDSNWSTILAGFSGVLMPGGSDINPLRYGEEPNNEELYGIDDLQDEVDFSLARFALEKGMPFFAICRGFQVTNVALGGSLIQDMTEHHRHHISEINFDESGMRLGLESGPLKTSCYHHQAIARLGDGIEVLGRSADGYVEAVRYPSKGWAYGVQWHPEDNYDSEAGQLAMLKRFVREARAFSL